MPNVFRNGSQLVTLRITEGFDRKQERGGDEMEQHGCKVRYLDSSNARHEIMTGQNGRGQIRRSEKINHNTKRKKLCLHPAVVRQKNNQVLLQQKPGIMERYHTFSQR